MILHGDALEMLATLEPDSVQCVVTSPPYWGLRDYGTAQWEGGDPECDHKSPPTGGPNPERYTPGGGEMFRKANDKLYTDTCGKCGARRVDQQLGLESTPEEYLSRMVAVFEQVRRVLRPDGVLFLNYGDCYAGGGHGGHAPATVFETVTRRETPPLPAPICTFSRTESTRWPAMHAPSTYSRNEFGRKLGRFLPNEEAG